MPKAKIVKKALDEDPALSKKFVKKMNKMFELATDYELGHLAGQEESVVAPKYTKALNKLLNAIDEMKQLVAGPTDEE